MTNSKPAYGDLEKRIEALEEELSFQRRSEGRSFYEKFIDAAAGNGIEMLTEVGYEMAARIGDLECQRDELVAANAQQLTLILDLGRRLNIATGAIKPTSPLKVDGSEAIRWIDCDSGESPNEGECVLGAVRWNGWEWSPVRYKSGAFYSVLADDDKPLKFIEHWARVPMEALP